MTAREASERYNIPAAVLHEYESLVLCDEAKKESYDDRDIERLSLMMTLHDVGFSGEETARYMRLLLSEGDTAQERMHMLAQKRSGTLDELHLCQRQLDRLDYLRYELSKNKEES